MKTAQTQFASVRQHDVTRMSWLNWFETWRAAEHAANEAMRAAERKSMLARDCLCDAPSDAELEDANRLREVADALFQQATAAMRIRTQRAWTSPRLGYDEMWSLVRQTEHRALDGRPAVRRPLAA